MLDISMCSKIFSNLRITVQLLSQIFHFTQTDLAELFINLLSFTADMIIDQSCLLRLEKLQRQTYSHPRV